MPENFVISTTQQVHFPPRSMISPVDDLRNLFYTIFVVVLCVWLRSEAKSKETSRVRVHARNIMAVKKWKKEKNIIYNGIKMEEI